MPGQKAAGHRDVLYYYRTGSSAVQKLATAPAIEKLVTMLDKRQELSIFYSMRRRMP
ncbi:MAG: hypothetical protein HY319_31945 [Armatimonadetes bacterium]|nr:hypothetical protein [Armatimonadota bacterium]